MSRQQSLIRSKDKRITIVCVAKDTVAFLATMLLPRISPLLYLCLTSSSSLSSRAFIPTTPTRTVGRNLSTTINMSNDNSSNVGLTDIGKSGNNGSSAERSSSSSSSDNTIITTWREKIQFSITESRKIRGGNYVQIATVDPKTNEPRCRTVVFRGFLKKDNDKTNEDTDIMKMITDKRSCKYEEVTTTTGKSNTKSTCEMVWWFSQTSEQYRIRGNLIFVGSDYPDPELVVARKQIWDKLSDLAREQFYWKEPGIPFDGQANVPEGGRNDEGKILPPPDNFLLMLLYPKRCDYLRLGDNFRQIDDSVDETEWNAQQVTP